MRTNLLLTASCSNGNSTSERKNWAPPIPFTIRASFTCAGLHALLVHVNRPATGQSFPSGVNLRIEPSGTGPGSPGRSNCGWGTVAGG